MDTVVKLLDLGPVSVAGLEVATEDPKINAKIMENVLSRGGMITYNYPPHPESKILKITKQKGNV